MWDAYADPGADVFPSSSVDERDGGQKVARAGRRGRRAGGALRQYGPARAYDGRGPFCSVRQQQYPVYQCCTTSILYAEPMLCMK